VNEKTLAKPQDLSEIIIVWNEFLRITKERVVGVIEGLPYCASVSTARDAILTTWPLVKIRSLPVFQGSVPIYAIVLQSETSGDLHLLVTPVMVLIRFIAMLWLVQPARLYINST